MAGIMDRVLGVKPEEEEETKRGGRGHSHEVVGRMGRRKTEEEQKATLAWRVNGRDLVDTIHFWEWQ